MAEVVISSSPCSSANETDREGPAPSTQPHTPPPPPLVPPNSSAHNATPSQPTTPAPTHTPALTTSPQQSATTATNRPQDAAGGSAQRGQRAPGVCRRSKFTEEDYILLLREVAAAKAHVVLNGETRQRFGRAAAKINATKRLSSCIR